MDGAPGYLVEPVEPVVPVGRLNNSGHIQPSVDINLSKRFK